MASNIRRAWEQDGLRWSVTTEIDHDTDPAEADCYDKADRDAFHNGDWCFLVVTVTVHLGGTPGNPLYPCEMSTTLGGVDFGRLPGHDEITMDTLIQSHPVPSMRREIMEQLGDLRAHLATVLDALEPTDREPGVRS
jgi:hypothetical protein